MPPIIGKRLGRNKWIESLMPDWVVERAHVMGHKQGQIWALGGVTITAMRRRSDDVPELSDDADEDVLNDDEGTGPVEVPEGGNDIDSFRSEMRGRF